MEDIAEQLARRDRFRRKVAQRMTYSERMAVMARLQEISWARLTRSPAGYQHFLKRNFRRRSVPLLDEAHGT